MAKQSGKERGPRYKRFSVEELQDLADSVEKIHNRAQALKNKLVAAKFAGELGVDGGRAMIDGLRYAFTIISELDAQYELTLLKGLQIAGEPSEPNNKPHNNDGKGKKKPAP